MKKNIILSFILVAFIAALCVTIMNIDDYYMSSVGVVEAKQQEIVVKTDIAE